MKIADKKIHSQTKDLIIKKHFWLYVLKLEQGKYYVGITSKSPEIRYQQHLNNFMAAQWTKRYRPIELFDTHDLGEVTLEDAQRYENKVTRLYMNQRGFNNVRGGDLSYKDNLLKRFGWYVTKDSWETVTIVIMLMLVIIFQGIQLYLF